MNNAERIVNLQSIIKALKRMNNAAWASVYTLAVTLALMTGALAYESLKTDTCKEQTNVESL